MYFLIFLLLLSIVTNVFLASEFLKKFRYWKKFRDVRGSVCTWSYQGNLPPGMYTLELGGVFAGGVLIGLDIHMPFGYIGYDTYGYIEPDEGKIRFSTYLSRRPTVFSFLPSCDHDHLQCDVSISHAYTKNIFPPHWWQRIGIF